MSILLLRTLTRKSIIGFGIFRDLTVQNVLDMCRTKELLHIYYTCRNIDFNQDLKDELCIYGEREINKKEKMEERYIKETFYYIDWCVKEMLDKRTEEENIRQNRLIYRLKKSSQRNLKKKEIGVNKTIFSKGALRNKNQW